MTSFRSLLGVATATLTALALSAQSGAQDGTEITAPVASTLELTLRQDGSRTVTARTTSTVGDLHLLASSVGDGALDVRTSRGRTHRLRGPREVVLDRYLGPVSRARVSVRVDRRRASRPELVISAALATP